MTNAVKLGSGMGTGMFYHAAAGTPLPAFPRERLDAAWQEVGYVSQDGINFHHGRSAEPLKDWAGKIRRMLQTDTDRNVPVPIISTTKEVLETIFGKENVTEETATSSHGNLNRITLKDGVMSGEEAFLLLMKDGDDTMMLGCTHGFITNLDDLAFAPGSPITWNATISSDEWEFVTDDGQNTEGTEGGD